ncbi:MAG: T9SS type A sorting domain-containing protein [Flavobacteriales bacterium]|nr:T9SS type A sorting domain-containing protein [Flavobacteriales bacterium]MCB9191827.1 T9SS type A sorting domain-containing protein [Flavobacteriales bacterium]MCB9204752.1 T9SS type A sorting domain-containing protein [Flavobacteriales bacterium]
MLKNLPLTLSGVLLASVSLAQSAFTDFNLKTFDAASSVVESQVRPDHSNIFSRSEGDTIWYDDFADLSNWTLGTTGAFGTADSLWEYTTDGPYGTFSGTWGDVQSPTASNGWVMFDSDGNGSANPTTGAPTGVEFDTYIQMANSVDLSLYPVVAVSFTEFYKELQSEVFLDVSTDGTNWTSIQLHLGFGANDQTEQDAVLYQDISSIAGGQATVWVRLRFVGFGYFWQVDDFMLVEGIENDVELSRVFTGDNEQDYLYTKKPLSQMTAMDLGVVATNVGGLTQTNVVVDWEITDGSTSVASGTETISASLASADSDTLFFNTGYTPTVAGEYTINMTVSSDETEANLDNNDGSETIEVTEFVWGHDYEDENYNQYGYAFDSETTQGESFEMGADYFCQVDGDEIYALVFPLGNNTTATSVTAKVYEDDPSLGPVSETVVDLVPAMLSTSSNVKFITVVLDDPVPMVSGSVYTATVAIEAGDAGYIMGNPIDDNDAGQSVYFAWEDTWYNWIGLTTAMRLNTNPNIAGVEDDIAEFGFGVYPNPTSDVLRVKVDAESGIDALNLVDLSGKLINTWTVNAGIERMSFDVSNLDAGVYFLNALTENGQSSQKLIIQ